MNKKSLYDADLFNAARDMYEALTIIRDNPGECPGDYPALIAKIDAALAKARGES